MQTAPFQPDFVPSAPSSICHAIVSGSAHGIAVLDREGRFVFQNPAAERILGVAHGALSGTTFLMPLHPQDKESATEDFEAIVGGRITQTTSEFRVLHPDGSWHWLSCELTNLLDDPAVGGVLFSFRDVTQAKESDRAVRESEQRFREMAAHINEAFFVTDAVTLTTLYMSPYWAEIFGRPLCDAYKSTKWLESVHPDDRDGISEIFSQAAFTGSTERLFRVCRPDGSMRWVRGRTFPVRDSAGAVQRIVGVATDVTELRDAEERFTQAQKMEAVGRLAGGVAHDFNNLLTVIIAEADMMICDEACNRKDLGLLKEIRSAAESAAALTKQLLSFSRRELVVPTVFVVDDAVQDISKMLKRLVGEDIQVTVNLGATGEPICMDRGQLEQVLANLVVNSRDAMPRGGRLTIETSIEESHENGARVVISVADTGTGMSDEVRARAFEPFFTTKARGKGTGLGLATCHGIIAQANGDISVKSARGIGTTFRIELPRAARDQDATPRRERAPQRGTETILLVEDDTGVRRVSARMLRSLGYSVIEARDAEDVQRILAAGIGRIDLLVTDVVMPGMGGRELAEMFRRERPGIKVIYATGYTDDIILQHQVLEHDVPLLRKPFTSAVLAQKVREALDGPLSESEAATVRSVA